MNAKILLTQVKRELWENKVSFVNTPLIITLLVIVFSLGISILMTNYAHTNAKEFTYTFSFGSDDKQSQTLTVPDVADPSKSVTKR